jgi:hypothetical protein
MLIRRTRSGSPRFSFFSIFGSGSALIYLLVKLPLALVYGTVGVGELTIAMAMVKSENSLVLADQGSLRLKRQKKIRTTNNSQQYWSYLRTKLQRRIRGGIPISIRRCTRSSWSSYHEQRL